MLYSHAGHVSLVSRIATREPFLVFPFSTRLFMTTISTSTTTTQSLSSSSGNSTSAVKAQIASLQKSISVQEEALGSASTDDEKAEINQTLTELRAQLAQVEAQLAQLKAASENTSEEPANTLLSGESDLIGTTNISGDVDDTPFGERTAYV
jgi:septal ring factor EnvC (AmiA/AmiB activator)